jgi:hypothetical protein
LASKLTRWKLDVHSETEYEKRLRESRRSLRRISGLGDLNAELLLADGYKSAMEVASSSPSEIAEVLDAAPEAAEAYVVAAATAAEAERLDRMVLRIAAGVSDAAVALRPPEPTAEGEEGDATAGETAAATASEQDAPTATGGTEEVKA